MTPTAFILSLHQDLLSMQGDILGPPAFDCRCEIYTAANGGALCKWHWLQRQGPAHSVGPVHDCRPSASCRPSTTARRAATGPAKGCRPCRAAHGSRPDFDVKLEFYVRNYLCAFSYSLYLKQRHYFGHLIILLVWSWALYSLKVEHSRAQITKLQIKSRNSGRIHLNLFPMWFYSVKCWACLSWSSKVLNA